MRSYFIKKIVIESLFYLLDGMIILNVFAYLHAYNFTHFSNEQSQRTGKPENIPFLTKITVLFTGVKNPKSLNDTFPIVPYIVYEIPSQFGYQINTWFIPNDSAKGIVIIFHGYASDKSKNLNESNAFHKLGYAIFLVDFSGHGATSNNSTTLGFNEASDVINAYHFIRKKYPKQPIILYGMSMGATAIMKAVSENNLDIKAIIVECPFGSLVSTTRNRFGLMNLPPTPLAELLLFWGGLQNNFPPFEHNCFQYATKIKTPFLLMYGLQDKYVLKPEIELLFNKIIGKKELIFFEKSAHEPLLKSDTDKWQKSVSNFLK